jgi:hypothetical protein
MTKIKTFQGTTFSTEDQPVIRITIENKEVIKAEVEYSIKQEIKKPK